MKLYKIRNKDNYSLFVVANNIQKAITIFESYLKGKDYFNYEAKEVQFIDDIKEECIEGL